MKKRLLMGVVGCLALSALASDDEDNEWALTQYGDQGALVQYDDVRVTGTTHGVALDEETVRNLEERGLIVRTALNLPEVRDYRELSDLIQVFENPQRMAALFTEVCDAVLKHTLNAMDAMEAALRNISTEKRPYSDKSSLEHWKSELARMAGKTNDEAIKYTAELQAKIDALTELSNAYTACKARINAFLEQMRELNEDVLADCGMHGRRFELLRAVVFEMRDFRRCLLSSAAFEAFGSVKRVLEHFDRTMLLVTPVVVATLETGVHTEVQDTDAADNPRMAYDAVEGDNERVLALASDCYKTLNEYLKCMIKGLDSFQPKNEKQRNAVARLVTVYNEVEDFLRVYAYCLSQKSSLGLAVLLAHKESLFSGLKLANRLPESSEFNFQLDPRNSANFISTLMEQFCEKVHEAFVRLKADEIYREFALNRFSPGGFWQVALAEAARVQAEAREYAEETGDARLLLTDGSDAPSPYADPMQAALTRGGDRFAEVMDDADMGVCVELCDDDDTVMDDGDLDVNASTAQWLADRWKANNQADAPYGLNAFLEQVRRAWDYLPPAAVALFVAQVNGYGKQAG